VKTILSFLLTPIYHIYFGLLLLLFHPVQVAANHIFGDKSRKRVVDILNGLLSYGLIIMGSRIRFRGFGKIPENRPLIIVSNHQSLYDIPPVVYGFRNHYPRFISKAELSKNLPSISYNLKYGKSALIDRQKGAQAVKEIYKLGKLIEEYNHAACIFPEGTRSKTGEVGAFLTAGLNTLLRAAPSAVIIPFVINGHSELTRNGTFPMQFGQKITYTVLDPVEPDNEPAEKLAPEIRRLIVKELNRSRGNQI
jgi:1-acyl-sn-glycerol-3-phosphate acyltransferase